MSRLWLARKNESNMAVSQETLRRSQGFPHQRGLISGYVWKLIRESALLTQQRLAEELSVDIATVQGWESGRRPLTALRVGDLARFRARLLRHGAPVGMFAVLADAIEADIIIDHVLHYDGDEPNEVCHPLAVTVHRRNLTNLITWPFTKAIPTQLAGFADAPRSRRGPVAKHPVISPDEASRFFQHLLKIADRRRDDEDSLLRRQAVYLLSFDKDGRSKEWLSDEHLRAMRVVTRAGDIPGWVRVRSAAVALTQHDRRDALLDFVDSALVRQRHMPG